MMHKTSRVSAHYSASGKSMYSGVSVADESSRRVASQVVKDG